MRVSRYLSLLFVATFAMAAHAGGTAEQAKPNMPAWIAQKPADADGKSYFVASGNSREANETQAQEAAGLDLVNQINRYLGVAITSESIATEISTANDYQALIVGMVKQNATGEFAGMRLAERYVLSGKSGVTVYLLGEYRTPDLEKEKAKRAALIREAEDAVAVPEAKGLAAENAGQLFDAARNYLEAASAAANGQVRNSSVKFERNVQNTLRALSRLQIVKVSGPAAATARKPFDQDFVVAVTDVQSGKAVGSADIAVGYREYQENGKFRFKTQQIKSDSQGMARLRLPDPMVVGNDKASFALDLSAYVRAVDKLNGKEKSLVDGVLDAASGKRVSFDFKVQSMARTISTAVLILELDQTGKMTTGTKTVAGIQQKLSAAGFKLASLAVGGNFLADKSDQEIQMLLKDVAANRAERIAYGKAQIKESDDRGSDGVIVKASAEINVVEIKTGLLLLTFTQVSNARGNDQAQAESAALAKLGQDIGDKLARDLP